MRALSLFTHQFIFEEKNVIQQIVPGLKGDQQASVESREIIAVLACRPGESIKVLSYTASELRRPAREATNISCPQNTSRASRQKLGAAPSNWDRRVSGVLAITTTPASRIIHKVHVLVRYVRVGNVVECTRALCIGSARASASLVRRFALISKSPLLFEQHFQNFMS